MTKEQVEKISKSKEIQDQLNKMIKKIENAECICCENQASLVGMYVLSQEEKDFIGGDPLEHKVLLYYTCLPCSGKTKELETAIWNRIHDGMGRA